MKKVLVIDGHNFMYRAYHVLAINDDPIEYLMSRVINMIQKTVRDTGIKDVIVVFDPSTENWRHDVYPEYKANRSGMPEDMAKAFPFLRKLVRIIGLPVVREPRMEGDDVLGTLARKLLKLKWEVYIATSDKDMAQLVKKRVSLVNKDNEILGPKEVMEKYGVPPEKIVDWLAVCGDKVDNVPGVANVGAKSVAAILRNADSIKEAMAIGIDQLPEKIRGAAGIQKKLEDQIDNFKMSRKLVKIKTSLDLECPEPGRLTNYKKYEDKLEKYLGKFTK